MTTLNNTRRIVACLIAVLAVSGCVSSASKDDSFSGDEGFAESELDLDGDSAAVADSGDEVADPQLDDTGDGAVEPELADEELADAGTIDGEGDDIDSLVSAPEPAPAAAAPVAEASPVTQAEPVFEDESQSTFSDSAVSTVTITDIRYVSKKDGGTVVIETSGPATYKTRDVSSQNQVVVEIANAKLPDHLKRPYLTKDFRQTIDAINAYQDRGSNTARIVIQFNQPTQASVAQSGKTLLVSAAGGGGSMNASNGFDDDAAMDDMDADGVVTAGPVRASDANDERILPTSSLDKANSEAMRFYGRPVSLEFRDMSVRDAISLIAEQAGANIVVSSEVDGNISLKLKQIPWDQALLLVMRSRNLGYVRQGSVLRVAPLMTLQKEVDDARKVIESQKASEPLKVKVIPVSYAKVDQLQTQITPFLSTRGKVAADVRTSSIIVTDIPENLERISNLVKALDSAPLQVLIEGKVVEASESFSRDFGINWGYRGQDVALGGQSLSHNLRISPGTPNSVAGQFDIRLGTFDVLGDLDASLSLAEREDQARVVSSPRILAMNNEPASINQKESIPIPQVQLDQGRVVGTTYTYRDINLQLEVTPQITADSDVIMQINIKREFAGSTLNTATPPINSREAKSKVLVRNGQTAVIGGIYQSDMAEGEQGLPWLRKIPVVGWLFKSRNVRNQKNELLLFLTPRILNADNSSPKEESL